MTLPFSQACENNKQPIAEALAPWLTNRRRLLEVGSGTGQHAVYLASRFPWLEWQTSDLPENHPGILGWLQAQPSPNLRPPVTFQVGESDWPGEFDALFTANTAHIMAWPLVQQLVQMAGAALPKQGVLAIYGPFNYEGSYTSASNEAFDEWLRQQAPERGIRDFEAINKVAEQAGLTLRQDQAMPANNRLIVWTKD